MNCRAAFHKLVKTRFEVFKEDGLCGTTLLEGDRGDDVENNNDVNDDCNGDCNDDDDDDDNDDCNGDDEDDDNDDCKGNDDEDDGDNSDNDDIDAGDATSYPSHPCRHLRLQS